MGQARFSLLTIGRLDKKFLAGGTVIQGPHRRTNDPISRDRMGRASPPQAHSRRQ